MSRVIGIICEYNPFHKGHKYLIDQIRQSEPDATIVAIMSGNIVQRGEFAMLDKYDRAKIALECGINAVFEMPYPYCGSCAEIFANAGVILACGIGCDAIYFGIERLTLAELESIANEMETDRYKATVDMLLQEKCNSFIVAKEKALTELGFKVPKSANDMLGLEYIRAINKRKLPLEYNAVKRTGALYNDNSFGEIMSASAIRCHFFATKKIVSVPSEVKALYDDIVRNGRYISAEGVNRFLHSYCLVDFKGEKTVFDTSPEMIAIIKRTSQEAFDSLTFMTKLSSKAFTNARLKRAILYSLFGVEAVDFSPKFTLLLGMDIKGRALLNKIRKKCDLHIITKHADGKKMDDAREGLELIYRIDALYNTMLYNQAVPSQAYKNKPIIVK